jgi:anti-anti-sigma regulatory factor
MLRIQRSVHGTRVYFTLSGRIQAEHLPELQRMIDEEAPQQRLVIDLAQVDLLDRDAVRFLAASETRGITLENGSTYIRESIARERAGGS